MRLVWRILTAMNKWEYAHKSISFLWCPPNYPVNWVHKSEEVPVWDTSRGYPRWEQIPEDLGNLHDVKPSPDEGYPRLVRVPGSKKGSEDGLTYEADDVLNSLTALYPDACRWRADTEKPVKKLKSDILELAEWYGAPYSDENNTLEVWLALISSTQTSLDVLLKLEDVGYDFTWDYVEGRRKEIIGSGTPLPDGKFKTDAVTSGEYRVLSSFSTGFMLHKGQYLHEGNSMEDWENLAAKHFREYEANNYYKNFSSSFSHKDGPTRTAVHFEPHGIYAFSPLGEWVLFKLSEEWRGGNGVKVCPVCGSLFTNNHGNRKYCRGRSCAYKAFKQNQKARAV